MRTLTIIRGGPGSGKSTLADMMAITNGAFHVEADSYFIGTDGVYRFDPKKLGEAHESCRNAILNLMQNRTTHIVLSNTSTTRWEIAPYLDMAEDYGYDVQQILMFAEFANQHGCPPEKVGEMRERFRNSIVKEITEGLL